MDKERSGETMKLGAFFHPTGNHVAAWLHPDAQIDAGTNFRHYAEITQTAERGNRGRARQRFRDRPTRSPEVIPRAAAFGAELPMLRVTHDDGSCP
jgi:hypothetical protein